MLALEPELVDLDELDPEPSVLPVGVLGDHPRSGASREFGEQILRKLTDLVAAFLQQRLEQAP
jgi:hypothetical protein